MGSYTGSRMSECSFGSVDDESLGTLNARFYHGLKIGSMLAGHCQVFQKPWQTFEGNTPKKQRSISDNNIWLGFAGWVYLKRINEQE